MRRFLHIAIALTTIMMAVSCVKDIQETTRCDLPEGTPVTLAVPFGSEAITDVSIGSRAEASRVDESRVHDLYVLIFDSSGDKFYGRYFTYEHLTSSLSVLGNNDNEGWWVDNVATSDASTETTAGIVKITTVAKTGCTMVVIANLDNAVTYLDGEDAIDRIAEISTLDELKTVKVQLEQNVINRDDLFLMLGTINSLSTSDMVWYSNGSPDYDDPNYNSDYKVSLERIDAKVKFRIKVDTTNISGIEPRYWQVMNVPSSCYLYPGDDDPTGDDRYYFDTDETYFEEEETDAEGTWQVFTFYMMENRQSAKLAASSYYDREKQQKNSTGESVGIIYENGDWVYAPDNGTYVKFDVVLTLTSKGIAEINSGGGSALTTDAVFTVHLGDFTNTGIDDYNTERNHYYSYDVTITNSNSIYVEVTDEDRTTEPQPGQEGSLLFATDEIVHCDAHYAYHSMTFRYNASLDKTKISWNVKTPFGEGGSHWDSDQRKWVIDDTAIDYDWVKFSLNEIKDGVYSDVRQGYPGDSLYNSSWTPDSGDMAADQLLDIHQLIEYIFAETEKEKADSTTGDFINGVIRMTAFVNEYYYEKDPRTGKVNPDLWREFVNAKPREMHILSDASVSADGQSDIVNSTHSIIQKSIQTIYNVSSPFLSSIWGTEHIDEMRNRGDLEEGYTVKSGWKWSGDLSMPDAKYCNDIENGRFNTAGLWGLNPSGTDREWATYLKYDVDNSVPELRDGTDAGYTTSYQLMAYSCLTRNRDNDGDGKIDLDEVRWYLASVNQIIGMWVGNDALSPSARIYQPHDASSTNGYEWRSHIVSSTCASGGTNPRVVVGEEGTSLYNYSSRDWNAFSPSTSDETAWNKIQSVRCVRNIGTFSDNGMTRDISYAPISTVPDYYYEADAGLDASGRLKPNDDGTYTLRFDNLNTKSIREYASSDLPFHSEYSAHNRVYLELDMQDPTNVARTDGSIVATMHDINEEIDSLGYNSYCPTGYRLPNMTELSLMVTLLPSSYWATGSNSPSRTYFSKGEYNTGTVYTSEAGKTGWTYDTKNLKLCNIENQAKSVRCVRDNNLTGDISGKLILSENRLYAADTTQITFNFTSTAAPFTEASLALCYTDASGNEKELSIPVDDLDYYSLTLRGSLDYVMPSDLPVRGAMTFKATLKNSAGLVESFTAPVYMLSNVDASIKLLPCEHSDPAETSFPVLVNAILEDSSSASITAWRLIVTAPDGTEETLEITAGQSTSWSSVYDYEFTSFTNLQIGTYTFMLEVDTSEGTIRTEEASMEIIKRNYSPNPDTSSATQASDITGRWEAQQINDMDFSAGDFIETTMDISDCIYHEATADGVTPSADTNIGLDDLVSFGLNDIEWSKSTLHAYYPAKSNNSKYYLHLCYVSDSYNNFSPYEIAQDGTVSEPILIIRFDKDGLYYNNILHEASGEYYSAVLETLTSASSLYIGSTEGKHRSRADYYYVRAVHNGATSDVERVNGNFAADPEEGDYL